jgi:hypothetical protein
VVEECLVRSDGLCLIGHGLCCMDGLSLTVTRPKVVLLRSIHVGAQGGVIEIGRG